MPKNHSVQNEKLDDGVGQSKWKRGGREGQIGRGVWQEDILRTR